MARSICHPERRCQEPCGQRFSVEGTAEIGIPETSNGRGLTLSVQCPSPYRGTLRSARGHGPDLILQCESRFPESCLILRSGWSASDPTPVYGWVEWDCRMQTRPLLQAMTHNSVIYKALPPSRPKLFLTRLPSQDRIGPKRESLSSPPRCAARTLTRSINNVL